MSNSFMRFTNEVWVVLFLVMLTGCMPSGVIQTGPDSFMTRAHSTLFTIDPAGGGAIANATELAAKHCASLGKHLVMGGYQTSKIGAGAQALVNFECLDEGDRDYVRPKIRNNSGHSITINNNISK